MTLYIVLGTTPSLYLSLHPTHRQVTRRRKDSQLNDMSVLNVPSFVCSLSRGLFQDLPSELHIFFLFEGK